MSNRTEQSGVARAGDGNQSSDEERQGGADGNKGKQQCGLGSVRPSGLGTDHSGETRALPLLSLRGPRNITLYVSICIV